MAKCRSYRGQRYYEILDCQKIRELFFELFDICFAGGFEFIVPIFSETACKRRFEKLIQADAFLPA